MSDFEIQYRQAENEDVSFIFNSFINSYVLASLRKAKENVPAIYKNLPSTLICQHYHTKMENHLALGNVIVACDKDDPNLILGYVVYDNDNLYWIYLKDSFRGHGIGSSLLHSCKFTNPPKCPYLTHSGTKLLQTNNLI